MTDTTYTLPTPVAPLDELAAALTAFQAEMPTILKSHTVKTGQYSYTYADLADVTEAAMPILTKHGLSFVCLPGAGELTGMLLHKSGQNITASLPITGATPQQVGSSLTYMRRYLLGCMTGIVTDDDDDGRGVQLAATRPRAKKTAAAAESPPPDEPPEQDPLDVFRPDPIQDNQVKRLNILAKELGLDRDGKLAGIAATIGREVTSSKELTKDEATKTIKAMQEGVKRRAEMKGDGK